LGTNASLPDGGTGTGVGIGEGALGRVVGKSGSVPVPQPGQVAAPSTVLLHPAADATAASSHAAVIPALMPVEIRTQSEYALSDWSDASDSRGLS
jgi:hypothetical protein